MTRRDYSTTDATSGSGAETPTRRQFLAAAGVAGITGFAGCGGGGNGNGGGGGGSTGTIDVIVQSPGWDGQQVTESINSKFDAEINIERVTTPDVVPGLLSESTGTPSTDAGAPSTDTGKKQYDVVMAHNYQGPGLIENDLLAPVNEGAVPNYSNTFGRLQEITESQFGDGDAFYGVPIAFDWLGYAYDSRKIPEHESSWSTLFSDTVGDVDLTEQIVFEDTPYPVVTAAALNLGLDSVFEGAEATISDSQKEEISSLLTDKSGLVSHYANNNLSYLGDDFLIHQVTRAEMTDAWLRPEGENIWGHINDWMSWAVPKEGAPTTIDTMVVPASSENKELAWQVVNEFLNPENVVPAVNLQNAPPSANPEVGEQLKEIDGDGGDVLPVSDTSVLDRLVPVKQTANPTTWEELYYAPQY
ncbi:ABC transporter substrate-binding protein [Halosimplex pelagicum]|uniref:Extracellular solute-binding protein n=1 Tax=Halosimplex pelagicum TaxID=869886 RepID=A0A7D5SV69_9EURY|nr:PotD/PotF family extracellular solute-binding protein [Halosimplex pelagicum]QLH82007.1 extracellular solute-binding protein [Halosimplex pelagicum]